MVHIVWTIQYGPCHMVYTLNIYHFRTMNMYETFHIVCVIFITWAQKGSLRKLKTIYLIVFLFVQTYWIYLGEIGSHQDIFHFTKIKSISPRFFQISPRVRRFHQVRISPRVSPSAVDPFLGLELPEQFFIFVQIVALERHQVVLLRSFRSIYLTIVFLEKQFIV